MAKGIDDSRWTTILPEMEVLRKEGSHSTCYSFVGYSINALEERRPIHGTTMRMLLHA